MRYELVDLPKSYEPIVLQPIWVDSKLTTRIIQSKRYLTSWIVPNFIIETRDTVTIGDAFGAIL